jgi:hypothetical protein
MSWHWLIHVTVIMHDILYCLHISLFL